MVTLIGFFSKFVLSFTVTQTLFLTEGGEPIKKKIKLKREAGKWMITPDEETVSIAVRKHQTLCFYNWHENPLRLTYLFHFQDTLLLLQNENPSGTSATMNPPASLNGKVLFLWVQFGQRNSHLLSLYRKHFGRRNWRSDSHGNTWSKHINPILLETFFCS